MQVIEAGPRTKADKPRKPMHRVGTHSTRTSGPPKTLGDRMAWRREQLGMKQENVAELTVVMRRGDGAKVKLGRTAYCMYERDDVLPDIHKIAAIARTLQCPPEWLAYGVGEPHSIAEVEWSPEDKAFTQTRSWVFDESWVQARYGVETSEINLAVAPNKSPTYEPGDVVVVRLGIKPSQAGAEYVFVLRGELTVAHLRRVGDEIRLYDADMKTYETVSPAKLNVLGKAVGRVS